MTPAFVYHFSEDGAIERFVPRVTKTDEALVWALDAEHEPLYWFPRDCPRAAWWALPTTTTEDRERWLGDTAVTRVLAMESGWLERLRATTIYRYRFDAAPFTRETDHPGCYLARETVTPLDVEPIPDLLERHAHADDVELRVTPSLWPLHAALTRTTLHWSFIRMRNARPSEKGVNE